MNNGTASSITLNALENIAKLMKNPYPGRGIVVGTSDDGLYAVQIYWIMGRSEGSRNRIFSLEGHRLFTEAADSSKIKGENSDLLFYSAMNVFHEDHVVSNGDQTDSIIKVFRLGARTINDALNMRVFESDAPNFTSRITGISTVSEKKCFSALSILRRSNLTMTDHCERFYYDYGEIVPGFGFCITTYSGDGKPLPSFSGEPYTLPIIGDINEVERNFWSALNEENRVSLAVKFINMDSGASHIKITNRFSKVQR